MCRITGFWDFKNSHSNNLLNQVEAMREVLVHGGPDDSGAYVDDNAGLALGHRRLSIIDLTNTGQQPMMHPSDRWVICYNGEVYNFKEVKAELIAMGEIFKSTSDTEVILHAWAKWGKKCLVKFRGMFAFAIWDKQNQELTIVRDRMGVKPLYYYHHKNIFMFASELKALHKHPDFKKELCQCAIEEFLTYGYISAPRSIFENTYKLEPGNILTINKSGNLNKEAYWQVPNETNAKSFNEEEFLSSLEEEMIQAFKLRMVSDVPVGVFLSGGVDSSLLTAILQSQSMNKINTFTIGFDVDKYDESNAAAKIAKHLGTNHQQLNCNLKEALKVVPLLPEIYDEPFGDTSAIPTILVSKLAREHVKVSLSADGGDEQYAGYNRYKLFDQLNKIKQIPMSRYGLNALHKLGIFKGISKVKSGWVHHEHRFQKLRTVLNHSNNHDMIRWLSSPFHTHDFYEGRLNTNYERNDSGPSLYQIWDMCHYLPDDILTKVDRATMSVSLEGREPLLDHHLIEKSFQCPYKYKIRGGYKKYPMRKILSKYVPNELTDQPKKGFGIPLNEWLQKELYNTVYETLSTANYDLIECMDSGMLQELVSKYKSSPDTEHPLKIWYLYVFFSWYNRWMK